MHIQKTITCDDPGRRLFAWPAERDPALPRRLVDAIGPVRGARVLMLGAGALELMCDVIRAGCATACILRTPERAETGAFDIVFLAEPASVALLAEGRGANLPCEQVWRVLGSHGRLAAVIAADAADRLADRLRQHGFFAPHRASVTDGRLLLLTGRPRVDFATARPLPARRAVR